MLIIEPVIERPWLAEWETAKAAIAAAMERAQGGGTARARERAREDAAGVYRAFLDRLRAFRVLDPACGSGNFLYLSLLALKDLEHRAGIEAEALGLQREFSQIGPGSVKGIEINAYAAELARVSVWIGEIQWTRRNGFDISKNPILKPLETVECRDALLNPDGTEAEWPEADGVVGNPPFLGDKLMRDRLGPEYTEVLRSVFSERVPGGADFVCYWFEKARGQLIAGKAGKVGLVATNSIRGGANRVVLDHVLDCATIFDAWSDEAWTVDGAAVRVSLVCLVPLVNSGVSARLNGRSVCEIFADLSSGDTNLTQAVLQPENGKVSYIGCMKKAPFEISGELARSWLVEPTNPNGDKNSSVLVPWMNGADVTTRPRDRWIVDFNHRTEEDAALYGAPFTYVRDTVLPIRLTSGSVSERSKWWLLARRASDMVERVSALSRFIVTPRVAKFRLFVWLRWPVMVDGQLVVISRDDDTSFGILHSRFHETWSLRLCTWLGVGNDPRYTPSTTFETFPFPEGLTPNIPAAAYAEDPRAIAIATAAKRLNELRETWLNPPGLVRREPEVVPGFPDRILPIDEKAAAILKKRTLTNLYNERPTWLANAHRDLDAAVAAAYGWPADISEDDALARLFALNQARAHATR